MNNRRMQVSLHTPVCFIGMLSKIKKLCNLLKSLSVIIDRVRNKRDSVMICQKIVER